MNIDEKIKNDIRKEFSIVIASRGMLEGIEQISGTITIDMLKNFIKKHYFEKSK